MFDKNKPKGSMAWLLTSMGFDPALVTAKAEEGFAFLKAHDERMARMEEKLDQLLAIHKTSSLVIQETKPQ